MELGLAGILLLIGLGADIELDWLPWSYPDTHRWKYRLILGIKWMCLLGALILFVLAWLY